jgi:uncharacterized membrane protein
MGKKSKNQNRNQRKNATNTKLPQPTKSSPNPAMTARVTRLEAHLESFSGPMPNPSLLKDYEAIIPGCAARMLSMAEKQAEHRQSLERIVIIGDSKRADNGLKAGFIVAIVGLISAVLLVVTGHDWAGFTIGGLDLVSLVSVFVYGTISRRSERAKKENQMAQVIQGNPPQGS